MRRKEMSCLLCTFVNVNVTKKHSVDLIYILVRVCCVSETWGLCTSHPCIQIAPIELRCSLQQTPIQAKIWSSQWNAVVATAICSEEFISFFNKTKLGFFLAEQKSWRKLEKLSWRTNLGGIWLPYILEYSSQLSITSLCSDLLPYFLMHWALIKRWMPSNASKQKRHKRRWRWVVINIIKKC